ncbi:MAG: D-tyrosyl-tRNA(Tyr) deacylase [Elusimicrobia bacterium]|nr:D-tyrosyl-tRNA(Tyr) deacylase [Elusimicrobiota bacterium]MDE2425399.1 D-tyrosyl-tRNA(Tyr) deacylase [Elusimicrobiota bacterium]
MKALVQRVSRARVTIDGRESREIGRGLAVFLGVGRDDTEEQARRLAEKLPQLRLFSNDEGKFDRSLLDEKGSALVVSQFTLFADAKSGRRPDFTAAAKPPQAQPLYERFCGLLREAGVTVRTGEFGAKMVVELINDGPVTLLLDTDQL